jgi:hypothetical protein
MSKGGAKAIGIGYHEGIFKAGTEQGGTTLEVDPIFKVKAGDHGGIVASNELDDTHGLGGHLTRMGEDTRDEDRDTGAPPRPDLSGAVINKGRVLGSLNLGVSNDSRGGRLGECVKGEGTTSSEFSTVELGKEGDHSRQFGLSCRMDNADVKPEEHVLQLDNGVNTQTFKFGRARSDDGSSTLVPKFTDSRVGGGGNLLEGSKEVGSGFAAGSAGEFGKEDAGAFTIVSSHHDVGGGVVGHSGTSFTSKISVDLVDALVGGMAEGEAGRAGDAVASIRGEDFRGGVITSTDVHVADRGVTRDDVTPGSKEG